MKSVLAELLVRPSVSPWLSFLEGCPFVVISRVSTLKTGIKVSDVALLDVAKHAHHRIDIGAAPKKLSWVRSSAWRTVRRL